MRKYWYSIVLALSIAGMALGDTFTNQMGNVSANPVAVFTGTDSGGNKAERKTGTSALMQPWGRDGESEELEEIYIKSAEDEYNEEGDEGAENEYSKVSIESVEEEYNRAYADSAGDERSEKCEKNALAKAFIEGAKMARKGSASGAIKQAVARTEAGDGRLNQAAGARAGGGGLNQAADPESGKGKPNQGAGPESGNDKLYQPADFSSTLFIGDSRTVGLSEYGQLGQAEVFADSGMSVYNLFSQQVTLRSGGKMTLDEVLVKKPYQIIYLMLGINELGYEYSDTLARYETVVDRIKETQPGAVLVLEANLHVTQAKSSQADIITNENINAINEDIKKLAHRRGCSYIDVNPLFDDESGSLDAAYSTDGAHILGKYYTVWAEWIRNGGTAAVSD